MAALNHFKVWKVQEVSFQREVTLKGQFDERPWKAQLDGVHHLYNPVRKNEEPIHDPKAHLVAYFIKQSETPQPVRWVTFRNQFGQARWILTDPAFLLVPAGKAFPPGTPSIPASLDHFVCYLVRETDALEKRLTLEDQFDVKRRKKEKVTKLEPALFAVPVKKNNERDPAGSSHLAIYDITPRDALNPPYTVWTKDQLRSGQLTATESLMLAVPSEKTDSGKGDGDVP